MSEQIEVQDPGAIAREMLAGVPLAAPPENPPPPPASAETGATGSPPPPASDAARDAGGHAFRSDFHRVGADGKPFTNKRGLFMPRGGRKPKSIAPPPSVPPGESPWSVEEKSAASAAAPVVDEKKKDAPTPPSAPSGQPDISDNSDDAAEVVCLSVYALLGFAFDAPEDCRPKAGDHDHMRRSTAAYLRLKGFKSPAGFALFLTYLVYFLRLIGKPKIAEKLRGWVRGWWDEMRANRAKPVEKTEPAKDSASPSSAPQASRVVLTHSLENLSERSA